MKIRKGMVPLLLFALVAAVWAYFTFVGKDRVPLERPGESIFRQP